jgi:ribosome-binding factor A
MRIRPERVAELIKREAAGILENDLNDPRVSGFISVTDAEVTPDLSFARIYVSVLAPGEEAERVLRALEHAAPFVRRQLAPRLKLREMPEIRFVRDDSLERGARVDELLRKIAEGETIDEGDDAP